ncbi:uncharacterized protein LACBIDRAFT_335088 [Laccaria bicolor S238N-H82]|uniref:Predicted protein n=1 Tax=Laccaria bicolor (strain S238N-H82 / ATCC MYA-4686) TaxID=486041 RepID=B0E1B5_LACBS|nr:uncharacterized protein LACBIDRAFT_335088 [Laccaria bicolor S238N-H82]EDQ99352.1 predicted protein [Laccaria bicolor S238N-H82]|eukprot:XP_001889998.1 predicted protein [Laccaria bicolor S238N-H82]
MFALTLSLGVWLMVRSGDKLVHFHNHRRQIEKLSWGANDVSFVFHDSHGFEAGRTSELDKVKEFLQKCSTNKLLKDHLHVIWYCIPINDEARPFTRAELTFFDECGTGRVPVIVLFTKADMLDAPTIKHLVDTGMDVEDAANKAPEELIAFDRYAKSHK